MAFCEAFNSKDMKRLSLQIAKASRSDKDGRVREGDEQLRQQCAKLIEKLPELSIRKGALDESTAFVDPTAVEDRWKAVVKLATHHMGEIVMLETEKTQWILTKESTEQLRQQCATEGQGGGGRNEMAHRNANKIARDAMTARHGQRNFSSLSDLWFAMENGTRNESPTKTCPKSRRLGV